MIELPPGIHPSNAEVTPIDFGFWMQPGAGAAELRIDRPGGRFQVELTFPPMEADTARAVVARLTRASFGEELRVQFPLLHAQGNPGAPVVDGAGQAGTTLALRGLSPNYTIKEGYWFSVVDADGKHFLHTATALVAASAGGLAAVSIVPPLRTPFADGAAVHLAKPMIEGKVPAAPWQVPVSRLIQLGCSVIEVA